MSNTTTFWSISYPRKGNIPGNYMVEVEVSYHSLSIFWIFDASARIKFEISGKLC